MPDELFDPVTRDDHLLGNPQARITLLEYGDYECPDCFNAQPIIAQLRETFGDDLRIAFRHFPQSSVHPHASAAAAAAEAAANQNRFWDMHVTLFKHQKNLADLDLTHLGLQLGLELYKFQSDLTADATQRKVQSHHASGVRNGVKGTPTFFINAVRYLGKADALGEHLRSL